MKTVLLIVSFYIMTSCHAMAGNMHFFHISSKDGLPHQQIQALATDADGNIWIGTRNGLSRYDGYSIKTYFHKQGNPRSLLHNFIYKLFVDSKKRIWICTQEGLCRYHPATDDFETYSEPRHIVSSIIETGKGKIVCGGEQLSVYNERTNRFSSYPALESGYILSLASDRKDNLYVATSTSIFYYNPAMTRITHINRSYFSGFMTGGDDIIQMLFDSKGRLWIGRNGKGVMYINPKDGTQKIFPASELSDGTVRVINEDRAGRIWLGTEKGVTIIHPDGHIEIIRHDPFSHDSLSDNAIYAIINDINNNIWIGSYFGGVDVLFNNNATFTCFEPGYSPQNIKGKVPRTMTETEKGVYWIATEDNGINIYDSITGTFRLFDGIPGLGTNIHSLLYDSRKKDMWIGTFRNGLFRYNIKTGKWKKYECDKGSYASSVFSIIRQRDGRLWLATTLGLRYYDEGSDCFKRFGHNVLGKVFIYTMTTDDKDNIWAGTAHNGLYRINTDNGNVSAWTKEDKNSGLKDNYVTCLFHGRDGRLWIGTNNYGLQYMDTGSGKIKSFSNNIFSPSCTVCSIIADKKGNIWISTSLGLFRYTPKNNSTVKFTTENGLSTNQFNFSSSLITTDGTLMFGTVDGLVSFNPESIRTSIKPFTVHLKSLTINNVEMNASTKDTPLTGLLDKTETIKLSYEQARNFSIEYGVIMPGNTNSIEYQLYLEGIDKDWQDVGSGRKFYGYNLPPGKYVLHIRANNSNQGWERNPEKTIEIIVKPPFWRSGWAYMIYTILSFIVIFTGWLVFSMRLKEKNEVKMANMEKKKIEEIDRAKFDFFTTVSHELRTPLSLIVAPLKSIPRKELSEESGKNLDLAIKNAGKLETLIGELVTFNQIETNNFPFFMQRGNPLMFIENLVAPYCHIAEDMKKTITSDCEDNGEDVWFSPSYVERIISNLLSNAMKFTPQGGRISVKSLIVNKENDTNRYLRIIVADNGIGIAKEELSNIFNKYYQTKRGYNMNSSGWGVGLALIKRMAEIHKGSVRVESEPGKGSTFTVELNVEGNNFDAGCLISEDKVIVPLSQYKLSAVRETGEDADVRKDNTADAHKMSVLLVDDNKELISFLQDYFSKKYNIFTAANGAEALEIARNESVQLVISDIMMPVMDGIQLCRTLKGDMATSHIPVILLTAKGQSDDIMNGYESGAEAYVQKPFDPIILELQVKNIISLQNAMRSEIAESDSADIESSSLSVLDKEFIAKMKKIVEENISNNDFSVGDITSGLGISRSLLHIKMKNLMGISTGDYIRKKRLDMACRLLRDGYNVSETAYRSGFSDPNYFSKTFKKHFGTSPTEWLVAAERNMPDRKGDS